jgi:hypothetical protein
MLFVAITSLLLYLLVRRAGAQRLVAEGIASALRGNCSFPTHSFWRVVAG